MKTLRVLSTTTLDSASGTQQSAPLVEEGGSVRKKQGVVMVQLSARANAASVDISDEATTSGTASQPPLVSLAAAANTQVSWTAPDGCALPFDLGVYVTQEGDESVVTIYVV